MMDEDKIRAEVKKILDKFAVALSKVSDKRSEGFVERGEFERVEGEGSSDDGDFKSKVLGNAPRSDGDFILVEKGGWK